MDLASLHRMVCEKSHDAYVANLSEHLDYMEAQDLMALLKRASADMERAECCATELQRSGLYSIHSPESDVITGELEDSLETLVNDSTAALSLLRWQQQDEAQRHSHRFVPMTHSNATEAARAEKPKHTCRKVLAGLGVLITAGMGTAALIYRNKRA